MQPSAEIVTGLAELSRALEREDLHSALQHVATSAATLVPGTVAASVTLFRDGAPYTFATSRAVALPVDEAQYADRSGPCLDAASDDTAVRVDRIAERRDTWPRFADAARSAGILSSLSLPLKVGEQVVGSLNLYGDRESAFDERAQQLAELVAAHGGSATLNATVLFDARALAEQLQDALDSRAVIDRAVGMLMVRLDVDQDEAFARLVQVSQQRNTKLRDVARTMVERGRDGR